MAIPFDAAQFVHRVPAWIASLNKALLDEYYHGRSVLCVDLPVWAMSLGEPPPNAVLVAILRAEYERQFFAVHVNAEGLFVIEWDVDQLAIRAWGYDKEGILVFRTQQTWHPWSAYCVWDETKQVWSASRALERFVAHRHDVRTALEQAGADAASLLKRKKKRWTPADDNAPWTPTE
jgi:hypothetical protein